MGARTKNSGASRENSKSVAKKSRSATKKSKTKVTAKKSKGGTNTVTFTKAKKANAYALAEIIQILKNIDNCAATSDADKKLIRDEIDKVLSGLKSESSVAVVMEAVSAALGNLAHSNTWFFRGNSVDFHSAELVWNAKHADGFEGALERALLRESDPGSFGHASDLAGEICESLRSPERWQEAVKQYSTMTLHRHGRPFWIANPTSGSPEPESNLSLYPSRAGLNPDLQPGEHYFIFRLRVPGPAAEPRFADSCGYIYWRPGGKTEPLVGCPSGMSGFAEAVTDRISLGHIAAEPFFISRRD